MVCTYLAIGDPHFTESNVEIIESFIKRIQAIIKDLDPNFVVILGDLLHSFEKIHTLAFNLAIKLLKTIAKLKPVYLIIGNHDYINNQQFLTENHCFNSLKDLYNITICDTVIKETILLSDKEYLFYFCPYVPPGRFEEALDKTIGWKKAKTIFAHQEFYGCHYNPLFPSVNGDKWSTKHPFIVSGHIHQEGMLGPNIYYPGNSIQENYTENGDKTVAFITISDSNKPKIEKIKLGLKRKIIHHLTFDNINNFIPGDNEDGVLEIKCDSQQKKTFKKTELYKKLSIQYQIRLDDRPEIKNVAKQNLNQNLGLGVLEILENLILEENKNSKNIWIEKSLQNFKNRIKA